MPRLINRLTTSLVALHPEGVDRNHFARGFATTRSGSPSTRRAWIEIVPVPKTGISISVALHPEGVDRNLRTSVIKLRFYRGRPPPGGRG